MAQAGVVSTVISPFQQASSCLSSAISTGIESWQELPEWTQKCALVLAGIATYHNYAEFLKNEGIRRTNLFNAMTSGRKIAENKAKSSANTCKSKVMPLMASRSVAAAVDCFYRDGGADNPSAVTDLKNALCPEWKAPWLLSNYI
jgi:hypothetical protein